MTKSKSLFEEFLDQLRQIRSISTLAEMPKICVITGSSDFLIQKACEAYSKKLRDLGIEDITSYEGKDVNQEVLTTLAEQPDLFATAKGAVIRRLEANRLHQQLLQQLAGIAKPDPIAITLQGKPISPKTKSLLAKSSSTIINCVEPQSYQIPKFVKQLAAKRRLKLTSDAIDLLCRTTAYELFRIDNILNHLELALGTQDEWDRQDIEPYLGTPASEHVFKIENHILSGNQTQASALIAELIYNREQPLGILVILARFARKLIQIHAALERHESLPAIAKRLRIPSAIINQHVKYLRNKKSTHLGYILQQCQIADTKLKSSQCDPTNTLLTIIGRF